MSLRVFHVIFIIVSVLLCLFVGLWGMRQGAIALGVTFFVLGAVLIEYGRRFFRKLREIP
jgi:hypothetical protein